MTGFRSLSASTVAVALAASSASAVFIDFNTEGDLAANFNIPAGTTSAQTFTEQPSGGVGDSRSVRPRDTDATAVYKNGTFSLAVGESFATSMFMKKTSVTAGTSRTLQLGLGEAATDLFTTNLADFLSARIDTTATGGNFQLAIQHRNNGTLATANQGASFSLTGDRIYRFTVTIARTGDTAYTVAGSVVDFGTDGLTEGATVASFAPVAVTNTILEGTTPPALYSGFRSQFTAGAIRLDNYSAVVPEPASMALLALGAILAFGRRR